MARGRKKSKNKKKTKARGKNNKQVTQNETNGADISAKEDLDALAAEIEATGVSTVKEEQKKEQNTKTKKKRKRNRRRKKSGNTDIANGGKSAAPAMATYSDFKKEIVQDEVTALRSIFVESFVRLPDADLSWQKGCPSFRIAQVKLLDDLMHAKFYLMTNWL